MSPLSLSLKTLFKPTVNRQYDFAENFFKHTMAAAPPAPKDLKEMRSLIAEYVWVGGRGEMRSKARVFHRDGTLASDLKFEKPEDLPVWNYDGSSTEQAPGEDSEVLLYPVAIYADPFRGAPHIL